MPLTRDEADQGIYLVVTRTVYNSDRDRSYMQKDLLANISD